MRVNNFIVILQNISVTLY